MNKTLTSFFLVKGNERTKKHRKIGTMYFRCKSNLSRKLARRLIRPVNHATNVAKSASGVG